MAVPVAHPYIKYILVFCPHAHLGVCPGARGARHSVWYYQHAPTVCPVPAPPLPPMSVLVLTLHSERELDDGEPGE